MIRPEEMATEAKRRTAHPVWATFLATVAAAMLGLSPPAAIAQTRILSGEHENFSRLALVFQQQTNWSIERVTDGFRVTFDPDPGPIDLGAVFDLIPRDRIQNVSQDDETGDLLVASTCDCHADAFDAGNRVLAIDIKDGAKPDEGDPASPGIAPLPFPIGLTFPSAATDPRSGGGAPGRDAVELSPAFVPPLMETEGFAASRNEEIVRSGSRERTDGAGAERGYGDLFGEWPGSFEDEIAAGRLRNELLGDLRRAAEADLVDLVVDFPQEPSIDATETQPTREAVAAPEWPDRNIALRTAFDAPDRGEEAPGLPTCPAATRFDFLASRTASDILASLPGLRAALVDEAGRAHTDGALRLVQAYLALGFGAEARALAEEWSRPLPAEATYRSLARILEEGRDEAPQIWSGLQRCPSPVALWAFLGHEPDADGPPVDAAALQRAFFSLPTHLRLQIGPPLSARLRREGLTAAAASIESNLAVLNAPPALSSRDRETGPGPDAMSVGPVIAGGAAPRQIDALLDRAGTRMSNSRLPAAADLDLAAAFAREHAGTERGDRLEDLVALRQLAEGDLEDAAVLVADRRSSGTDVPGEDWRDAFQRTAGATITAKGDAELLALALHRRSRDLLAMLSPEQTVSVAERLTALGFPEVALSALAPIEAPRGSPARRARARAILASGDAAQALAMLAGQTGAEAGQIRAEALSALGRHALAAQAYADVEDTSAAAREAWMSGDPDVISRFGTEQQRKVATGTLASEGRPDVDTARNGWPPASPPPDAGAGIATASGGQAPSLSQARDLAERSLAVREALQALLADDADRP